MFNDCLSLFQVDAKRQAKYNTMLAIGVSALIGTIAVANIGGLIKFYGTPWHLMKKD